MGSKTPSNRKETELGIPHPQLNHVRLADSNGHNCLRMTSCLDRKEYSRWKTALQLYKHHDSLFLPESHAFNATALCGAAGTAEVGLPLARFYTQTILIC